MLSLFRRSITIDEARMRITSNKYNFIKFRTINKSEMVREEFSAATIKEPLNDDTPLYKMTRDDPNIVKSTFELNGLKLTDKDNWNILWTNNHPKLHYYEGLNEYQKINHLPGGSEITRKDKICANIVKQQVKHGKEAFDIIPDTYMLPEEFADFYDHYYKLKANGEFNLWIVKPNALSRGRGIYLVSEPSEIPVENFCVVSRYVRNPLLINGLKFDIRLYIVVTSVDPLRIYVYNEGLIRFCTEKFDLTKKDNKFSHLTNYSINKKSEKYVPNKEANEDDTGQKWSVTALNKYMEKNSIDILQVWTRIYDLIIKTIIACEPALYINYKKTALYRTNCFELYGFDVLLDDQLRPWLMEVNLTPSLACDAALDHLVKSNMVADMFTLVGLKRFNRKDGGQRTKLLTSDIKIEDEFMKSAMYMKISQIKQRHKEIVIESLEEYERKHNFVRIYPAKGTNYYDKYFEASRSNYKMLYKFLYEDPLQINEQEALIHNPMLALRKLRSKETLNVKKHVKKVHITKDQVPIDVTDVLIEYIERLVVLLKVSKDIELKAEWIKSIEDFTSHTIWDKEEVINYAQFPLWQKLNMRLVAIKNSKRNLSNNNQARELVIKGLNATKLEEMLKLPANESISEVIKCLVPSSGPGILNKLLNTVAHSNEKEYNDVGIHHLSSQGKGYYIGPLKSSERIVYSFKDKMQPQRGYTKSSIRQRKNSITDSPYSNTIPLKNQSNLYILPKIKNSSFTN